MFVTVTTTSSLYQIDIAVIGVSINFASKDECDLIIRSPTRASLSETEAVIKTDKSWGLKGDSISYCSQLLEATRGPSLGPLPISSKHLQPPLWCSLMAIIPSATPSALESHVRSTG